MNRISFTHTVLKNLAAILIVAAFLFLQNSLLIHSLTAHLFFVILKSVDSVILSRTDSIGDMVLTLPMAKALKEKYPSISIAVLGRPYTKAVVETNPYIDAFIELDDFLKGDVTIRGKKPGAIIHVKPETYVAKRAKELRIPLRIGTSSRLYHWFTCNKLVRLSRKRSDLHEAQLNLKLLKPFGINKIFSFAEIAGLYALNRLQPLDECYKQLLRTDKFNLVLHPKSRGNAREWGIENYTKLVQLLDSSRYNIFVSGTENEKEAIQPLIDATGNRVTNLAGKMPLAQFLSFISHCDGLVACSTGPLPCSGSNRYSCLWFICTA